MSIPEHNAPTKRRSKGEKTRQQILTAAIEILALNGIKGTTHRAVAQQAQLQLSLTTYYFKDIQELVQQAFTLNSSQVMAKAMTAWQQAFEVIEQLEPNMLASVEGKQIIAEQMTTMACQYIAHKLNDEPISLAVEQLLFTEVQRTEALRELATQHWHALLAPFIRICRYFNQDDAEIDADIMLTLFTQIEYRHLNVAEQDIDWQSIKATIHKVMTWVLKI